MIHQRSPRKPWRSLGFLFCLRYLGSKEWALEAPLGFPKERFESQVACSGRAGGLAGWRAGLLPLSFPGVHARSLSGGQRSVF